nr:membrane protein insertion efficiency factor YidD [Deinococcus sp. ZS9-10]
MVSSDALALTGIALYQRWLSPHKGFRCAHAAFYGGASCSAALAHAIREEGLSLSASVCRRHPLCRLSAGLRPPASHGRPPRAWRVLLWPAAHPLPFLNRWVSSRPCLTTCGA